MPDDPAANIHIILVRTTHPGNIGASARAMKTMGLSNLDLVHPAGFPSAEVTARAAGADDLLAGAVVYDTLADAVARHDLILATSARVRSIPWPDMEPEQAAARLVEHARAGGSAAVLFGRESSGLSNRELETCSGMIRIPTNPGFSSLNIASAVQIICYELRKCLDRGASRATVPAGDARLASVAQMELLYQHLESMLLETGFLDSQRPRRLMHRLRRLFNRAQLDENEYNILRGIFAAVTPSADRDAHNGPDDSEFGDTG